MAYAVSLSPRSRRDLAAFFEQTHAQESDVALGWYRGLRQAILGLEELPNRCPPTAEDAQLRHLLYGRPPHVYRIIFRVLEARKRVIILHIRHGARGKFSPSSLR